MKRAADRFAGEQRIADHPQAEDDGAERQAGDRERADVVDDAPGAVADVLEPDRHGKPGADLQRQLAEARWCGDRCRRRS